MNKILKVFTNDMKKISTNVIAVVIILGLSILPSLYAWFNIFSNWDPYGPGSTGNIKVAVISNDEGAEISGLEINIGATVVDALKSNKLSGGYLPITPKLPLKASRQEITMPHLLSRQHFPRIW